MIPEGNGLGQVGLRSEQACDSVLQMWSVCVCGRVQCPGVSDDVVMMCVTSCVCNLSWR